ncbi:GNAT family N-acetyltransferase [Paracoccus sp. M683]|uniref:GNAT family N-acetyltransferase n=1 Tax=Paracoccus sp. M683 TaxID=2594268 RepID=UPI00117F2F09|nr:GNAT family N-acetyltransferase [Paracoccus sp. M683]TRW98301.1 GNAT family N-acetyltransferase [Paracoccus sp. M683]
MITLAPLAKGDPTPVAHIRVAPAQEPFCGTIAGHFAADEPLVDFHRILRDGQAVGFFKLDRGYAERLDYALPGDLGVRGVMVDLAEQGRGTGTAAMAALAEYVPPRYPQARALILTVNMINPAAIASYRKAGFVDTGKLCHSGSIGPQHIMRMMLG